MGHPFQWSRWFRFMICAASYGDGYGQKQTSANARPSQDRRRVRHPTTGDNGGAVGEVLCGRIGGGFGDGKRKDGPPADPSSCQELTTNQNRLGGVTQNPKTDTEEIRGKLGRNSGRGDQDDAQ